MRALKTEEIDIVAGGSDFWTGNGFDPETRLPPVTTTAPALPAVPRPWEMMGISLGEYIFGRNADGFYSNDFYQAHVDAHDAFHRALDECGVEMSAVAAAADSVEFWALVSEGLNSTMPGADPALSSGQHGADVANMLIARALAAAELASAQNDLTIATGIQDECLHAN